MPREKKSVENEHKGNVYEMEDIIQYKREHNTDYYLIKWVGYSIEDATWEPRKNIIDPDDSQKKKMTDLKSKWQGEISNDDSNHHNIDANGQNQNSSTGKAKRKKKNFKKSLIQSNTDEENDDELNSSKRHDVKLHNTTDAEVIDSNSNEVENESLKSTKIEEHSTSTSYSRRRLTLNSLQFLSNDNKKSRNSVEMSSKPIKNENNEKDECREGNRYEVLKNVENPRKRSINSHEEIQSITYDNTTYQDYGCTQPRVLHIRDKSNVLQILMEFPPDSGDEKSSENGEETTEASSKEEYSRVWLDIDTVRAQYSQELLDYLLARLRFKKNSMRS